MVETAGGTPTSFPATSSNRRAREPRRPATPHPPKRPKRERRRARRRERVERGGGRGRATRVQPLSIVRDDRPRTRGRRRGGCGSRGAHASRNAGSTDVGEHHRRRRGRRDESARGPGRGPRGRRGGTTGPTEWGRNRTRHARGTNIARADRRTGLDGASRTDPGVTTLLGSRGAADANYRFGGSRDERHRGGGRAATDAAFVIQIRRRSRQIHPAADGEGEGGRRRSLARRLGGRWRYFRETARSHGGVSGRGRGARRRARWRVSAATRDSS